LKSAHESNGENLFRFYLISRHIEGEGESTVTVAFEHISLLLLGGLFGSLGDNEVRFRGKLTLKVEQSYPASLRIETTVHPVALDAAILCESRTRPASEYNSLLQDRPATKKLHRDWRLKIDWARSCFTVTVT